MVLLFLVFDCSFVMFSEQCSAISSSPGMTITYALIQMVEKVAETTDRARIITKARATKLLQGPARDVIGLVYEKGGSELREMCHVLPSRRSGA